jgi:cysteine desulfurase / selenocysteine lyase
VLSPAALQSARRLFPHASRGIIFMNHAGTSPLSTRVVAAVTANLLDRSEGKIDTYETDARMAGETRAMIARMINAESADRIALFANTSDAINVVASGLEWRSGDRVLLNSAEFPANVWPFLNLKRLGVTIDTLEAGDGVVTPDMIDAAITPSTRLVGLSAVQFLSGYRADLAAIGDVCRKKNIVFAVDAIQAVGAVQVDVRALKFDALSAGGQKWQMSPHGTGLLYVTEALQEQIHQASLGWLAVRVPWEFFNFSQPIAATARRYEGGSLTMPSLWGMHAALGTLLEFGPAAIESHILALTGILLDGFVRIRGIRIVTPSDPARRAGIVTFKPPNGIDPDRLLALLEKQKIFAAVREGLLRYSPHFYMTPEEMQIVTAATAEAIASLQSRQ